MSPAPIEHTGRRAWHRRASRPVTAWIVVWVAVALAQVAIPQSRWLMVHIVTLGLVTNSIMIWGQHFAEALLKLKIPDAGRRVQIVRMQVLNLGIVVTCIGMIASWPWVVVAGATVVGGAVTWYAVELGRNLRRALAPRFGVVVRFYVAAAALLPVGAGLGASLAFAPPEPWLARLLIMHQAVNVLGFVGLTIVGTLLTLWPTMLRTPMARGQLAATRRALWTMVAGVAVTVGFAIAGLAPGMAAGVGLFVAGLAMAAWPMLSVARRKPPRDFPTYSVAAGYVWFVGTAAAMAIFLLRQPDPTAAAWRGFTVPLIAGGLVQVLLGAMSYLMPTVMGGGPRQVRASCAVMNAGGAVRVGVANAGLLTWLLARGWVGMLGLGLAIVGLATVAPLLMIMVVRYVRARRAAAQAEPAPAPEPPRRQPRDEAAKAAEAAQAARASRRDLLGFVAGAGGVAALAGAAALFGPREAAPTTAVRVVARGMRFVPDRITVPAGNRLLITVVNDDPSLEHDLYLDNGRTTGRIAPRATASLDAGVITTGHDGWCTVPGHRAMGMVFHVDVTGAANPSAAIPAPLAIDLSQPPGAGFVTRDAALPPLGPRQQALTLEVTETLREVAPGQRLRAMTYDGQVMGPVITGEIGSAITATLINHGTMGHSVDFHAGTVSPDRTMRTIQPGESLTYPFVLDRAGIWLYHCSTAPMSVHIAAGMFGAVIVPPRGLAPVDHEFVIVQSDAYLTGDGAGVDEAKLVRGAPDLYLFNGHANQYAFAPLRARAGQRVRWWVLAAGPSRGVSFHVVGGQFDTVFKEGAYLLRPGNPEGGGAQALDLAPAQGGFVEATFSEPGTYPFVNHDMVAAEHGARGLLIVE